MTPVIVLQARMGSSRLPGKAIARIGGRTILQRCLDRLRAASGMPVVLATTTRPEDDVLALEAQARGVPVCRGADADVLSRFLLTARTLRATHVVRATADNPAVDLDAPARVMQHLVRSGADYVAEPDLPCGAGVEALSVRALAEAAELAIGPGDREHVTPVLRRAGRFHAVLAPAPAALRRPDLRLTVDTSDDLAFMRRVMGCFESWTVEPPLAAIIGVAHAMRLPARSA